MNKKENTEINKIKVNYEQFFNYIIVIIGIALIIICCIGYNYSINNYDRIISEKEQTSDISEYRTAEVSEQLFDSKEYPRVLCTSSTIQMGKRIMANFTKQDESNLEFNIYNENTLYKKLFEGEADVILVNNLSKVELLNANNIGIKLESYKIANDGLVFLMNSQSNVNGLTLKQIQKIYSGEENNWSKLNGNDESIIACQRTINSEIQNGMTSLVMNGIKMVESSKENIIADDSTLYSVISDYEKNFLAIGYTFYSNFVYDQNIKLLSINGIDPSYENIKNETYPIKSGYYAVIKYTDKKNEKINKFIEALLSKRGKAIIEEAGYIAPKE